MAEGHSFHRCNNVILFCYSRAYDKFKQALDRVHRMNSEKPINVYVVFCDGTIDQRLESLTDEKADSAELILDGNLMGERAEEVNFAQLLQLAQTEFNAEDQTLDEGALLAEWPTLRNTLATAQRAWDAGLPSQAAPTWLTAPIISVMPKVAQTSGNVVPQSMPTHTTDGSVSLECFRARFARLVCLNN
jgi:hypothetical protein